MMKISEPIWLSIWTLCKFQTFGFPAAWKHKIIKFTLTENTRNKSFYEVAKWINNRWYFTYNQWRHFISFHFITHVLTRKEVLFVFSFIHLFIQRNHFGFSLFTGPNGENSRAHAARIVIRYANSPTISVKSKCVSFWPANNSGQWLIIHCERSQRNGKSDSYEFRNFNSKQSKTNQAKPCQMYSKDRQTLLVCLRQQALMKIPFQKPFKRAAHSSTRVPRYRNRK